jgi:hypothetical protein
VTTTQDGPLAVSRRRLDDAVRALADPTPIAVDGCYRWSEPLYAQLRQALSDDTLRGRRVCHSKLPCRADVLAWLIDVDTTVARWEPDAKTTIERLHHLAVCR